VGFGLGKANVYIDGFNFYYRCVKGTPHKWCDPAALAALLLPKEQIHKIYYFTARVRALPRDPDAPNRQQVYLRALATIPNLTIVYGHFLTSTVTMPLAKPPLIGSKFATVLKSEEKGSDVNLATQLLLDAFRKACDLAFIVSNDSDLAEPIRVARTEFGLRVGIGLPVRGTESITLLNVADFFRRIRDGALAGSQFPNPLTDANGTFSKPATW
jgi:uncharacterized LabA/DUF88 family protein